MNKAVADTAGARGAWAVSAGSYRGWGSFSQGVRRTPIRRQPSRSCFQAEHAQMHAQRRDAAVEGGRGQFAGLTGLGQVLRLLQQIEERALIAVHAGQRRAQVVQGVAVGKEVVVVRPQGHHHTAVRVGVVQMGIVRRLTRAAAEVQPHPVLDQAIQKLDSAVLRDNSGEGVGASLLGIEGALALEQVEDQVLLQSSRSALERPKRAPRR